MSFSDSIRKLRLNISNDLEGECINSRKEWEDASFPLNDFLGNNDGNFAWGGSNFKHSAKNLELGKSRYIVGELRNMCGGWQSASLDLSQHIGNFDGALRALNDKQEYLADDSWHDAHCFVINEASGLCLDLDSGNASNGTKVQSWSCISGNQNQMWHLEKVNTASAWSAWTLRNVRSGTYLDLSDGNPAECTKTQGWQRGWGADKVNQEWFLVSEEEDNTREGTYFRIQNANSFTELTFFNFIFGQGIFGSHRQENASSQRWKLQRS